MNLCADSDSRNSGAATEAGAVAVADVREATYSPASGAISRHPTHDKAKAPTAPQRASGELPQREGRARPCRASLDTTRTSCTHPEKTEWAAAWRDAVSEHLAASWPTRARRMRECGRAAVMIVCRCCDSPHLVPFRCGARTCPTCAPMGAAAIAGRIGARVAVHDLLQEVVPWNGQGAAKRRSWRMVTLTSPAAADVAARFAPRSLARDVRRVRRAFPHWWRLTDWGKQSRSEGTRRKRSRRDTSYIIGQEIAPGGMVHIHALIYGEYLPQAELQALWSRALGVARAIVDVRTVRGGNVADALREVLKYATKGERRGRDDAARAAAVEVAFRNVRRVELGGAIRAVRISDSDGATEDVRDSDLHDEHAAACESCGVIGEWRWEGMVSADAVRANGGFGRLAAVFPAVESG
jgi:hypothetical protein